MKQIDLREGARRQHRTAALFAVIQCWLLSLDGLAFSRQHLQRLIGLERFKGTRVDWLREDLSEFFPYQEVYWFTGKQNSLGSLFVSRRELKPYLPVGSMSDKERIKNIRPNGPRIAMFKMWARPDEEKVLKTFKAAVPFFADAANYDERLLSAYLALLAQGQISPKSLPELKNDIGL
ncbi:hypothetical protein [Methylocaldum sp.]|uniref:hypothetical protein n=1 Tax=Methylocaldum sp. TaxID=1969727 RepID=UPI002D4269D7|nr:hypothetical protein [Methylocaldum sp.]HYE35961.1 hypothetical protein [Methylocaldum sp.]